MDLAEQSRTVDAAPEPSRQRTWRFWLSTAALLVLAALTFGVSALSIALRGGQMSSPGWSFYLSGSVAIVSSVDRDGTALALRPGDEVTAVNGRMSPWVGPARVLSSITPGESYTVAIRRGQRSVTLSLVMGNGSLHLSPWGLAATGLISVLLFSLGMWIHIGGPEELTARLAGATFMIGGLAMSKGLLDAFPGWNFATAALALALARLPRPFQNAVGWDFLSRFPQSVPEGPGIRLLRRCFYGVASISWFASNARTFAELANLPNISLLEVLEPVSLEGRFGVPATLVFDLVTCAAVVFVLVRNYRLLVDRDSRRRIRWAAVSFGFIAVSIFLLSLFRFAFDLTGIGALSAAADFVDPLTTISVGLIPVVLTYAVIKHQILGVRLVIRRGLQYLLAKNVLRLILLSPVLIVLASVLRHPDRSLADLVLRSPWQFYPLVMITAAISLRYRREMSRWLDRQFFRVALREEETWVALVESLQLAQTEEEIAVAAAQNIDSAFVPDGLHIFFRSPTDGELEISFSDSPDQVHALLAALETSPAAALASKSIFVTTDNLASGPGSRSSVHQGSPWLVVPLPGSNAASVGVFVLGPKKSDEPYTLRDRELLQAIAAQVVMACEMLQLKRGITEHNRERITVLGRLERDDIQLLNECPLCGSCFNASLTLCPTDGGQLELTLPVERIVAGRYRLDRRIGSGGMGVVYQALDLRLNKAIAVKIMVGALFGNRSALMRFRQEAQAVALLRHPNIIGVHDFGQLPAGGAFFAMDLVDGLSWREHLRLPARLHPQRVASWVEQLCQGVAAAHSAGVVHRDLKPENVMIAERIGGENIMIMDFGVAKLHTGIPGTQASVSLPGAVFGTRAYMAPEQALGRNVDGRADIYAIGMMTLETLARLPPPAEGANPQWIERMLSRISAPGSQVASILGGALAHSPELRPKHVAVFGSALAKAIQLHVAAPLPSGASDDADTMSIGASS